MILEDDANILGVVYSECGVNALYKEKNIKVLFADTHEIDAFSSEVITVRKSDVPSLKKGEIININSKDFKVLSFSTEARNPLEFNVLLD